MAVCARELESALARVTEEDMEELKKAAISKNFTRIKKVLGKYVSRYDCFDIDSLKKYVVKRLLIESMKTEDTILVEIPLNMPPSGSMAAGTYPCFTVAEVLYASIFDADSETAHEKMYNLIEPVLLSPVFTASERKTLFLQVTSDNWDTIQSNVVSILSKLDEDRRKLFCWGFTKLFHLFPFCFDIEPKGVFVVKVQISGKLLNLCPELKTVVVGGES